MGLLDFRSTLDAQFTLGRNTWPPPSQAQVWADVELLAALRMSDDVRLRQEASVPWQYPYVVTPVPRMLSRSSANMLFGEPPDIGDDSDADSARVEFIVTENQLPSELVRAGLMSSSEGDVYGRIMVRPDLCDAPIIEFASRACVIPEFSGRFLTGATFVSTWQEGRNDFFRLLERHTAGLVEHTLYRGTGTALGQPVALDSYGRTNGMNDSVLTGMPRPLVAFIPNSIDSDPTRGFSDYRGLEARFLAMNEAATIGKSNVTLTGQKRALLDAKYLTSSGRTPKNDTFLIRSADDSTAGEARKGMEILEYSFEATELVAWIDHMIDSSITFAGMSPQSVGRSVESGAISGTAQRLKMAHSLIESAGKGRHFDTGIKQLLAWAKQIDARRTTEGGFGRKYSDVTTLPSFERADPLPRDDMEAAQRLVLLTNAEAISPEEKVRLLHPDWSEKEVTDEVAKLGAAGPGITQPNVPAPSPGGGAGVPPRPVLTLPPGGAAPGAPV